MRGLRPSFHAARGCSGFTLVELLIGLVVGGLVLGGLMSLGLQQARQTRLAEAELRATRELEAIDRLLQRLLRQAIPAQGQSQRFVVAPNGEGVAFRARLDDGSERALALRLAQGTLEMRIDGGTWQHLHDTGTVRVAALRFEVTGDGGAVVIGSPPGGASGATGAPGCGPAQPPTVRWRLAAARPTATGADIALLPVERRVQVRDRAATPGCEP